MNYARFDQSAAEDGQRSVMLTNSDARLLNGLDEIVSKIQSMREDNTDSERDVYLAEIEKMARSFSNDLSEGWL